MSNLNRTMVMKLYNLGVGGTDKINIISMVASYLKLKCCGITMSIPSYYICSWPQCKEQLVCMLMYLNDFL